MDADLRRLADRIYLRLLAERGWASWAAPPEQAAERERLWEEAKRQAACDEARARDELLPRLSDLRGLFRGGTGGKTAVEFLRDIRGE